MISKITSKSIAWLVFLSAAMLFSCTEELPINQFEHKGDFPTMAFENLKATYTEKGKTKGKLQANIVENYDGAVEPYVDFPNGISIVHFNKENQIEASLTANRAIYYQSKKTWEAIGNVVVSNINGTILRTEKLYGDEKEKKIHTNEFVKITKADGTILNSKAGFVSNTELTVYKFMNVDGRLYFKSDVASENGDGPIPNRSKEKKDEKLLPKMKDKPTKKP